jgi:hypothetical protein
MYSRIENLFWKVVERPGELTGIDSNFGNIIVRDLPANEAAKAVEEHNKNLIMAFVMQAR